jgi:hypothetical protein
MAYLMQRPSAWIPIAMSIAAVLLVLGYVAAIGVHEPQADEGAAARIFQLLLAGQVPVVAFFSLRWVPQMPRPALQVIALQLLAALATFLLVVLLEM